MSGCWYSFSRCVGNRGDEPNPPRYRTKEVESIKFENLLMLEIKEQDSQVPFVKEEELEHVRGGRLDRLAEEQRLKDQERDEELKRQEEQLRREEEAYYASKRAAVRKVKQTITTQPHSTVAAHKTNKRPSSFPSWLVESPPSALEAEKIPNLYVADKDEEDFDQFLESVKAKQQSLSESRLKQSKDSPQMSRVSLHSITSDDDASEEEIDFGYWESASMPPKGQQHDGDTGASEGIRAEGNLKDVDLNLL